MTLPRNDRTDSGSSKHIIDKAAVLRAERVTPIDRGGGIKSVPLIGKWNTSSAELTTGMTTFTVGTELPLHSHNVDETVLILAGTARVEIDGESDVLSAGDVTWIPAGVPHAFACPGPEPLRIYWVYAGRDVTRTVIESGETFEHLSSHDRAIGRASASS